MTLSSNPVLRDLHPLVGTWKIEVQFPGPASTTAQGTATIAWSEDRAFLAIRSSMAWEGPGRTVAVVGRDDQGSNYSVLYADDRGVSRVYQMSYANGIWRQWREAPSFWQRFTGELDATGAVITAMWENSPDGREWQKDFDLTYRREQ